MSNDGPCWVAYREVDQHRTDRPVIRDYLRRVNPLGGVSSTRDPSDAARFATRAEAIAAVRLAYGRDGRPVRRMAGVRFGVLRLDR